MNKKITAGAPQQVSDVETAVILSETQKILDAGIPGDFVEMGCYRGDTSLLLMRALKNSEHALWLYDSFEGLPQRSEQDGFSAGTSFKEGELLVTKREVVERFKKSNLPVPKIRKNFFENLTAADLPEKIVFAFLDGDLYQSIKTSLKLVLPKMTRDETDKIIGTIIIHDYNNPELPGVARAVDEWLSAQKTAPKLQRRETLAIISW